MRDQYAGDLSDVIKFGLLRALAGQDRRLGVAWYYSPGDDGGPDGRHLEWRTDPAWIAFDPNLHKGLSSLPERSIAALEAAEIWPPGSTFHRFPMPRKGDREAWGARKRSDLDGADIVFLDPDNGLGPETEKHATFAELRALRQPGRAIVFITFPGRSMPHDQLVEHMHNRVMSEAGATNAITLRTNVSVPTSPGATSLVQRQRWFTIVDPDDVLVDRLQSFTTSLSAIPRVTARIDRYSVSEIAEQPPQLAPKPLANTAVVEVAGRNWLVAQLLTRGFEVAVPVVDRGVDLIVFREVGEQGIRALPLQLKCFSGEAFNLDRKYEGRGIPLVYIWNVMGQPEAYMMTYDEALAVLGTQAASTHSWRVEGKYAVTVVGGELRVRLKGFASRWDWLEALLNSQRCSG